ncbi:MAG: sugar ABC transporter permease [Caldilinea sp.]|nr:sugar ABC transporter permease [Caldilinea sp.]MDW8439297.1 sugar ABC transporter permease [Caldilineaceae bacterium]
MMTVKRSGAASASFRTITPQAFRDVQLWLMAAPFLLGALLLVIFPAVLSFALAFMRYDALAPPTWIGFENFVVLFRREVFWIALRNTLAFAFTAAPLQVLGALLVALLFHPERRGVRVYRAAVYLTGILPDVAYALIWLWLLNPLYGPINLTLARLGLPTPAWLVDPRTALASLAIVAAVRMGEGMVLLIAARRTAPDSCYDAARIDGADRLRTFWHITLPWLAPWLLLLLARDLVMAMHSSLTPVLLMTGGGPGYATTLLPFLMYEEAFTHLRLGEAAAMMVTIFALIAPPVWLAGWLTSRRWSEHAE